MIGRRMWTIATIVFAVLVATEAWARPALDVMEMEFKGGHTKEQIQIKINKVMVEYNTPTSEGHYWIVGGLLIGLRIETNVTEMDTLQCMEDAKVADTSTFRIAAALCAGVLSAKQ